MMATGGRKRWDSTQKARCWPPVLKRARLYAIIVPITEDRTVAAEATIRLLMSPWSPR